MTTANHLAAIAVAAAAAVSILEAAEAASRPPQPPPPYSPPKTPYSQPPPQPPRSTSDPTNPIDNRENAMRILATKLKNTLPKQYHCALRDVKVNGDKRGCVGFIQFEDKTVYVNTEACGTLGYMVRTAAHGKDYIGGRNHWAKDSAALTLLICELINQNHFPA